MATHLMNHLTLLNTFIGMRKSFFWLAETLEAAPDRDRPPAPTSWSQTANDASWDGNFQMGRGG